MLALIAIGLVIVILIGALICVAINIAISPIILGILGVACLLVLANELCDKR